MPRPAALQITDIEDLSRYFGEQLQATAEFPNINNARLHRKQQIFHQSQMKGRIFQGGNQSGKSFVGYHEDACWVTNRHPYNPRANAGPQHGRVIVPDFTHGADEIAVPNLSRLIPPSFLQDGSWDRSYSKADHKLTLANGSTIEIMSQEQDVDAFAGTQRDFLHGDEEVEKERWEESQVRLIRRDGFWWQTQTPVAGVEWIYDQHVAPLLKGHAGVGPFSGTYTLPGDPINGTVLLVTASIWDNAVSNGGVLPDEAIERVLSALDPDERRVREYGIMPEMGGSAFPEFKRSTHVLELGDPMLDHEGNFRIPDDARVYTTMDDGRENPTAWAWVAAMNDGTVVTFREHYRAQWGIAQHVDEIKRIEDEIDRRVFMRVGDPAIKKLNSTEISVQSEYARLMAAKGVYPPGIAVNQIPSDRRIHRAKVHQYFQINPLTGVAFWRFTWNCPMHIKEITGLKNDRWINKQVAARNNKKEGIRDKNNHTYDATKYLASIMPDITPARVEHLKNLAREQGIGIFASHFGPPSSPMVHNVGRLHHHEPEEPDDDWLYADYSA